MNMHSPRQINGFRLSFILIMALISACSSQPKTEPTQPTLKVENQSTAPKRHQQKTPTPQTAPNYSSETDYRNILNDIVHWQVQGKLGIRLPDNSGSLYFNWKQEPTHYAIHLSGPLGQGATWIRGNHSGVSIQAGNKPKVFADTPEALLRKTLGWELPIQELYYWTRGLPSPLSHIQQQTLNSDGRLQTLSQSGWLLSYKRYKDYSGWSLPQKLIAERNDVRLTFIIKNWQIY